MVMSMVMSMVMAKKREKKPEIIMISGEITHVVFRKPDNWGIFKVSHIVLGSGEVKRITTCKGIIPEMADAGSEVECHGTMENSTYGNQLNCVMVIPAAPDVSHKEGVMKVLCKLPGIGPVKAAKAIKELGYELAWRTAKECPSYLGISDYDTAVEAQEIAANLEGSFAALVYLLGIGVTAHQSDKIIKKYTANKAIEVVSDNPYRLINDIDGMGFNTVDGIAFKAGIKVGSTARINACLMHCLFDSEKNNGNIWINGKYLIKMVLEALKNSAMKYDIPINDMPDYGVVRQCIAHLETDCEIVIDGMEVYSSKLLSAEKTIYEVVTGTYAGGQNIATKEEF